MKISAEAPAIRLRTAALRFAEVAGGPVFDHRDSTCIKANRALLRAAREYARHAIAAAASRTYHREVNRHMKAQRERSQ